jgi:hypothetical protein
MEAGTLARRTEEHINPALIPPALTEQVAAAACEGVLEFFQQPGVQEKFDAWLLERKRKNAGEQV